MKSKSIGEVMIAALQARGVTLVFGIPGVHTIELYRGLAASGIRHITPRHEQGAGFMADGYARVSGKPGVALVITGPGLTNTLTPMAQARADSVPMLVISGVNARHKLGLGLGHLHELPDQQSMAATVACASRQISSEHDLIPALDDAFQRFASQRGGPVHLEVPTDVMALPCAASTIPPPPIPAATDTEAEIQRVGEVLARANAPVILAGGGARWAEPALTRLAEQLDAPVIQTVNARGLMHGHPLCIPASASLAAVRGLIKDADTVLALGTEFGPTDYDMYQDGGFPALAHLIRVDICSEQLARHPARYPIWGRVENVLPKLLAGLANLPLHQQGALKAARTREAAWQEIDEPMRVQVALLEKIRELRPHAIIVGDSTQAVYAGNLYYDHDRAGGWFNAATGYGALGYAIPAAIGAALADPEAQVICITGDGGAQFTLPELMVAVDEQLPILFIVWNNQGYLEIESWMTAAGITPVGCDPAPPDFKHVALSCGMPYLGCEMTPEGLGAALGEMSLSGGPGLLEVWA